MNSTENTIEISVTETKTIIANFQQNIILYEDNSPLYPTINLGSSNVMNSKLHPSIILDNETIYSSINYFDDCEDTVPHNSCNTSYSLEPHSFVYFDYNNDQRTDLFGFLKNTSREGGPQWGPGKYVLVDDVFNNPRSTYYPVDHWWGGVMELNDFNNDSFLDIIVFFADDHDRGDGTPISNRTPIEILYFENDGSFNRVQVGPDTSTHDLTTFDVDLDGDIDIVNLEWWLFWDDSNSHIEVPLFYLNDGTGYNFEVTEENFLDHQDYVDDGTDFAFTGVDSFDLDNDGYIDLILGGTQGRVNEVCDQSGCETVPFGDGIFIYWGNSQGNFSDLNKTKIDFSLFNNGNYKLAYEFGFIDINNDGKYDFINVGTDVPVNGNGTPNSGGFIDLYINNGNRTFDLVTDQFFDQSEWDHVGSQIAPNEIPVFYRPVVQDVDDDGDFDIIPYSMNSGALQSTPGAGYWSYYWETNVDQFYWQNNGGTFNLVKDINYEVFNNIDF